MTESSSTVQRRQLPIKPTERRKCSFCGENSVVKKLPVDRRERAAYFREMNVSTIARLNFLSTVIDEDDVYVCFSHLKRAPRMVKIVRTSEGHVRIISLNGGTQTVRPGFSKLTTRTRVVPPMNTDTPDVHPSDLRECILSVVPSNLGLKEQATVFSALFKLFTTPHYTLDTAELETSLARETLTCYAEKVRMLRRRHPRMLVNSREVVVDLYELSETLSNELLTMNLTEQSRLVMFEAVIECVTKNLVISKVAHNRCINNNQLLNIIRHICFKLGLPAKKELNANVFGFTTVKVTANNEKSGRLEKISKVVEELEKPSEQHPLPVKQPKLEPPDEISIECQNGGQTLKRTIKEETLDEGAVRSEIPTINTTLRQIEPRQLESNQQSSTIHSVVAMKRKEKRVRREEPKRIETTLRGEDQLTLDLLRRVIRRTSIPQQRTPFRGTRNEFISNIEQVLRSVRCPLNPRGVAMELAENILDRRPLTSTRCGLSVLHMGVYLRWIIINIPIDASFITTESSPIAWNGYPKGKHLQEWICEASVRQNVSSGMDVLECTGEGTKMKALIRYLCQRTIRDALRRMAIQDALEERFVEGEFLVQDILHRHNVHIEQFTAMVGIVMRINDSVFAEYRNFLSKVEKILGEKKTSVKGERTSSRKTATSVLHNTCFADGVMKAELRVLMVSFLNKLHDVGFPMDVAFVAGLANRVSEQGTDGYEVTLEGWREWVNITLLPEHPALYEFIE